jgi:hypothetical protein
VGPSADAVRLRKRLGQRKQQKCRLPTRSIITDLRGSRSVPPRERVARNPRQNDSEANYFLHVAVPEHSHNGAATEPV